MFIDVTRWGGMRTMRLAVAAIAYIDVAQESTAIHLVGGESLRVNEDPAEIELRMAAVASPAEKPEFPVPAAAAEPTIPPAPMSPILSSPERDASRYPAKRGRRNGQ